MDKQAIKPLSGFRDIATPAKGLLLDALKNVFSKYGYETLETPIIEKREILLSKYGDEADKLLYMFNDNGDREVGLRYDLTVPLARFVAGNLNELTLPYKRYEIGPVFRAERAQKGRYRQFTQADIDIIGAPEISSENELFEVVASFARQLDLKLICKINDRRIVNRILNELGVAENLNNKVLQIIDKRDKISLEQIKSELAELQIDGGIIDELITKIERPLESNDYGIQDLAKFATALGFEVKVDLSLVRGLDYYTGAVFEFGIEGYPSTLIAGGRYDKLVEDLINQQIPAVGLSFGVDRIIDYLGEDKIIEKLGRETIFVVRTKEDLSSFNAWLDKLRQNYNIDLYLDGSADISKQLKYANRKGYTKVYIPKSDDWSKGQVAIKDMTTGAQTLETV